MLICSPLCGEINPPLSEEFHVIIDSLKKATLSAQLASPVKKIYKQLGESFNKGDLILELDSAIYHAQVLKTKAVLEKAFNTYKAKEELFHSKIASLSELKEAYALWATAQAEYEVAKKQLEACKIIAPYRGKVANVLLYEHELPQVGQPLVEVVGDEVLLAKMLVDAKYRNDLKPNSTVNIYIRELDETLPAQIKRVGSVIDPISSTIAVEAEIDNKDSHLISGMTGTTELTLVQNTPSTIKEVLGNKESFKVSELSNSSPLNAQIISQVAQTKLPTFTFDIQGVLNSATDVKGSLPSKIEPAELSFSSQLSENLDLTPKEETTLSSSGTLKEIPMGKLSEKLKNQILFTHTGVLNNLPEGALPTSSKLQVKSISLLSDFQDLPRKDPVPLKANVIYSHEGHLKSEVSQGHIVQETKTKPSIVYIHAGDLKSEISEGQIAHEEKLKPDLIYTHAGHLKEEIPGGSIEKPMVFQPLVSEGSFKDVPEGLIPQTLKAELLFSVVGHLNDIPQGYLKSKQVLVLSRQSPLNEAIAFADFPLAPVIDRKKAAILGRESKLVTALLEGTFYEQISGIAKKRAILFSRKGIIREELFYNPWTLIEGKDSGGKKAE